MWLFVTIDHYYSSVSAEFDPDMAEAMTRNTRRYISLFSEAVQELLPEYKQKEVSDKFLPNHALYNVLLSF